MAGAITCSELPSSLLPSKNRTLPGLVEHRELEYAILIDKDTEQEFSLLVVHFQV